ncbi:MAG TPA: hypothetical protein VFO38_00875 [Candidatus Saccharimonadales bacterium]|nr:hypothetical protein [Candidatus Saccharimonadales bacterium]
MPSGDHRKLNEEMVRLGSTPCIGDLKGGLGAVTSVDARIKFPMFHEGCGQFVVDNGSGSMCRFLAITTPMAQIFETAGEHARESITVIYTDDGGQLWLMPWSPDVDDLGLLGKAQWVLSKLAEATIKAAVQVSADSAGYGGKSGANPLWKAVVFPVPSGTVWRKVDWLAGASLEGVDGPNIVTVHQKFSIEFDTDKVPFVDPPRVDDLLGKQVKVLNRPFVVAKVMPTPSLEVSPYPFRVDWMAHVSMSDWAQVQS